MSRLIRFVRRYERFLSAGALALGFIIDSVTLTRVDLWSNNLVLITYLVLATLGIMLVGLYEEKKLAATVWTKIMVFVPLVIQFAFGGLLSGFTVFYSRSSSFAASWPFILVLFALLIGNEFFREKYMRVRFQLGLFHFTLFSYAIFIVPVIVGKIGRGVFVGSTVVSLVLISLFIFVLHRLTPMRIRKDFKGILAVILSITAIINFLYFANIIPPIPLALKDVEAVHSVSRNAAGNYDVLQEVWPWYRFYERDTFHMNEVQNVGNKAYVFSAVFAPTRLTTRIVHVWNYFDPEMDEWQEVAKISYDIQGGREEGYRGYTTYDRLKPGRWRVDIETTQGQTIGQIAFRVKTTDKTINFEVEER